MNQRSFDLRSIFSTITTCAALFALYTHLKTIEHYALATERAIGERVMAWIPPETQDRIREGTDPGIAVAVLVTVGVVGAVCVYEWRSHAS